MNVTFLTFIIFKFFLTFATLLHYAAIVTRLDKCDRVRPHTHDSRRNFSFFYFILFILLVQQRRYSDGGYIIISPSPRSHLADEVRWRRVANQRVARGLGPPFCAAVVGWFSGCCRGMTRRNWGVVLPYYNPLTTFKLPL